MGNVQKCSRKSCKRLVNSRMSKGERHGWASFSEIVHKPLREIVGRGERVERGRYSVIDNSCKLMVP